MVTVWLQSLKECYDAVKFVKYTKCGRSRFRQCLQLKKILVYIPLPQAGSCERRMFKSD